MPVEGATRAPFDGKARIARFWSARLPRHLAARHPCSRLASPDLIQIPKDRMIREDGNSASDSQLVTTSASADGMCDPHTYRN